MLCQFMFIYIILQRPNILKIGKVKNNRTNIILPPSFFVSPWIILLRFCENSYERPKKITNVRIRKVIENEIIIFWSDSFSKKRF